MALFERENLMRTHILSAARLKLIGVAMLLELAGESCLFGTTASEPAFFELALSSGRVTNLRVDETRTTRLGGGFLCRSAGTSFFRGEAYVTNLPRTASITVTLIDRVNPTITFSPSPVEFGTVEPEATVRRSIVIEVSGEAATVRNISIRSGANFSITDPNGCRGRRISAGSRCSFTVIFDAPNTFETAYEDTAIVEMEARTINDRLAARTRDKIAPVAEPSPVAFGRVEPGSLTRRSVTIAARDEVTIDSIAMERGTNFGIIDPNRCIGARIAASGRCTFTVILEAPAEAGRELRDKVLIGTNIRQVTDEVTAST